jgi:hypothetical protein
MVGFGVALDQGGKRAGNLVLGPTENATRADQLGIRENTMTKVVGRLDEKLRHLAAGPAQLVDEPALLRYRKPINAADGFRKSSTHPTAYFCG